MMKEDGPPTSNKMTMEMFFFKLCLNGFASEFYSLLGPYRCKLCKFQANLFWQSFEKKYISMVILFDVGGPHDIIMADSTRREDLKFQFSLK